MLGSLVWVFSGSLKPSCSPSTAKGEAGGTQIPKRMVEFMENGSDNLHHSMQEILKLERCSGSALFLVLFPYSESSSKSNGLLGMY